MDDPTQTTVTGLLALARMLAESLCTYSEELGGRTEWRVRIAAAQARAIEDLLEGVMETTTERRRAPDFAPASASSLELKLQTAVGAITG